ncbi:MAG: translation initiation factor IF-2 [Candidatus Marinimicrobia bacterium]|nr:translation initiation factor IF-2 [Candidatus Neomarinimicrobiota bacterium]
MAKKRRVYEVAKELNISHKEIMDYLESIGVECQSHMSPIDDDTYFKILKRFAKEKSLVEELEKERERKEAEIKRKIEEELRKQAEREREQIEKEVFEMALPIFNNAIIDVYAVGENVTKALVSEVIEEQERFEVIPEKEKGEIEEEFKEILKSKFKRVKEREELEQEGSEIINIDLDKEKIRLRKEKQKKKEKKTIRRIITREELEEKLGLHGKDFEEETRIKGGRKRKREEIDEKKVEDLIRRTKAKMVSKSTKKKYRKQTEEGEIVEEKEKIKVMEFTTVENLANLMDVEPSDVIQKCIEMGLFVTINQRLDFETISLIADEFGYEVEQATEYDEEIFKIEDTEEDKKKATPRPPVVVVMGHVDHGKTSLLDYIRRSNVVAGEAGGITQHIGAYEVEIDNNKKITFIDTPGHEAFTEMRARGAQVTDIVVLVVAADDGVMPQTIEAINHAKAANVPIVVAINKIDKPNADPERVKRELSEHGVLVEDWGGNVQCAEISAKTGKGIDELLEKILLEAELLDLKANANTLARGTVIEAKLDRRHGPVATILIRKGTLRIGEPFVCGATSGKVRLLLDERGNRKTDAKPSDPVQVVGFDSLPQAADIFAVVNDEKEARRIAFERQRVLREQQLRKATELTLDKLSQKIAEGEVKQLPVIVKADVDGSLEAVCQSLQDLGNEEVSVNIIHRAVGQVSDNDILLAKASQAIIITFNLSPTARIRDLAKRENVEIRSYNVIYEMIDDVKAALGGMLKPEKVEESLGVVEVRQIFKVPKVGLVAGCYVTSGKVVRNAHARIKRNGEVIFDGFIESLKRFKDDVREVHEGFECGISLAGFDDYKEGDEIEVYDVKSVKRTLE